MPRPRSSSSSEVPSLAELRVRLQALWPAARGSLNRVCKPCIRPGCKACASGRRHPVWLYTFSCDGRRRCLYVPEAQVAALQQALANGRELERLLGACGERLLREDPTP